MPRVTMRVTTRFAALLALGVATPALADDPNFSIVLKNNQFVPSEVQIPAGVKVKLIVRNENPTASEFESTQFHREKVVPPARKLPFSLGLLIRAVTSSSTISTRKPVAIWSSNSEAGMLATAIIVFREVLEASLVVGIVLAASRGVPRRGVWVTSGIAAGALGAALVAAGAGAIARRSMASGKSCSTPQSSLPRSPCWAGTISG